MSQSFDAATGWPLVSMQERDRSQLPLWPELETELEQALAAQASVPADDSSPVSDAQVEATDPAVSEVVLPLLDTAHAAETREEVPQAAMPVTETGYAALPVPGEHRFEARAEAYHDADAELGQRLRAARERADLGRDEIARLTRIAPTLIQAIEEGRFERLGATVFARGYLRSYSRAVGLPDAVVGVWEGRAQREVEAAPAPSLAATSPRRSSSQVASPIVYTLLTLLIAVPAYYGVRQAQQSPLLGNSAPANVRDARATDVAPASPGARGVAAPLSAPTRDPAEPLRATESAAAKADAWRQPVMASLTPMLGNGGEAEAPPVPLDVRQVEVRLTGPSWIEIVAGDGRVIERSLLPTGSVREYAVPRSARVRIGDAGVVELRADGKVLDLTPHTHANVATLTLDEAG